MSSYFLTIQHKATSFRVYFCQFIIPLPHIAHPTFGYRKITDILCRDGLIKHKPVHRLMRTMDIITIYPKPNLSKRHHAQYVKPYLLRNLKIVRPNQVWGVDLTCIKMEKGFMYLFIIID
ncbi:hypothetical protein E4K68_06815 [Desulfosporosinus sp. Sb-LF]|nr:hypothetical protein E4K68_06815 [Desulfosporosinus sp. Sb-LF]